MDNKEILRQLQPWREKWKRPAWLALTRKADGTLTASKFGGAPWLAADEKWPTCQECQAAMPLFLQLDLDHLPAPLAGKHGTGLLQLFYCVQCSSGFEPFSKASLVRIVAPDALQQTTMPKSSDVIFPAQKIAGWQQVDDYPDPSEQEDLGLQITYDYAGERPHISIELAELGIRIENLEDDQVLNEISKARSGDKLSGWPVWIQDKEYPSCPQCQTRMDMLFQIDSNDHIPFMFGDMGVGQITQCPTHKEVVAFGWACS